MPCLWNVLKQSGFGLIVLRRSRTMEHAHKMRQISRLLLVVMMLTQVFSGIAYAEELPFSEPLASQACIVKDLSTGKTLYQQAGQQKLLMASLTKMMTGLIVSETYSLNKSIKSKKDYKLLLSHYSGAMSLVDSKGRQKPILKNEVFKAKELYNVMMVYSANDAALLFADTISGSEKAFVKKMNARAKSLGLKNTRFTNCHGLSSSGDEVNQYTTAEDVAKLAQAAYRNPQIMAAVGQKTILLTSNYRTGAYKSGNSLLSLRTDVKGLKTGYTKLAGNCFASIVSLDGKDFLIVTLNSEFRSKMFKDHQLIYGWLEERLGLVPPKVEIEITTGPAVEPVIIEIVGDTSK